MECKAVEQARWIADEALFPYALDVDSSDRVPGSHLDLLATEGFYGMAAPPDVSTLDVPDYPAVQRIVELLAGGCLTTTFVWIQHHGAMMAMAKTGNEELREAYLADLAAGRCRAGMAIGSAVKPGPPLVRAEAVDGGYEFSGVGPWVTGWDMIDTLYTAGRDADDVLVWTLLDAKVSDTMRAGQPLDMVAARASRTVTVEFDRHFVPHERVLGTMPQAEYLKDESGSLRFTGALSHGLAERAISLLGDDRGELADDLASARQTLLEADPDEVPRARAASAALALRAAAALAVHAGTRSLLRDSHAQRLIREANFVLLFGTRPGIRAALLDHLTTRPPTG